MPSSARKSSIGGGIRRSNKAHVPYRGDNPEVGKKTGIAVEHVDRNSDGFEHFEDLIRQADGRTPPRPKGRRSSAAYSVRYDDDEDEYDDEDGEMSMQIDSPVQHLANLHPPTTPTRNGRRSSSRPVARTTDRGFDEIPNPRPLTSTAPHRSNRSLASGPSNLSKSYRADSPENVTVNNGGDDYDGGMDYSNFDDDAREPEPSYLDQTNTNIDASFSRIEDDDEEQTEGEPTPRPVKSSQKPSKGKERAIPRYDEEDEHGVEQEIAQGLEDVDMNPSSEDEPPPPPKKSKPASPKKKPPKPKRPSSHSQKENREYRDGVRRSARVKIQPLEWWRGERCVYGRPTGSQRVLVASVKEIVRLPKEDVIPLAAKRKRGSTRPRSTSRAPLNEEIPPALPVPNPEEGWDENTEAKCTVVHYTTREEVERRIAWTANMVDPKVAAEHQWSFHKIFGDDDFIAAGQILIPPGGIKPSKPAKDNTYVFYVIEGAVNFKIHNTSMIVCSGGQFMVPRGNNYFIENICQREVRLFFTQARKVDPSAEELAAKKKMQAELAEARRRKSQARTPSVGPHKTPPHANGRDQSTSAHPSSA